MMASTARSIAYCLTTKPSLRMSSPLTGLSSRRPWLRRTSRRAACGAQHATALTVSRRRPVCPAPSRWETGLASATWARTRFAPPASSTVSRRAAFSTRAARVPTRLPCVARWRRSPEVSVLIFSAFHVVQSPAAFVYPRCFAGGVSI